MNVVNAKVMIDTKLKPKWEFGAVVANINTPLYPASKNQHNKLLTVPYFIYRGDVIRIGDKSIVSAVAVEKPTYKVDLSLRAAFKTNSEDSKVRAGMPELDYLFEFGPKFSFLVHDKKTHETWLDLQFRGVFSTDFSNVKQRGYAFEPSIYWKTDNLFFDNSVTTISISSTIASKKTHQYFYSVDNQYVTEQRGSYSANSGYLGTSLLFRQNFEINGNYNIFLGLKLNSWQGSRSENSPLFEEKLTYSFVLGLKWNLYQSKV